MKKRLLTFLVATAMLIGCAAAAETPTATYMNDAGVLMVSVDPRGSRYLDCYAAGMVCNGGYEMEVVLEVFGTHTMDKIGVEKIVIQEWSGSRWIDYMTVKGSNHPEFYAYDTPDYGGTYTFDGFPDAEYRAIVTAYAERDGGSDTGTVTSGSAVCTR